MDKVVLICGPTGIGKSALALDLAQRYKGEIINSDSMQVYKHMQIGTAKPSLEERAIVPHHLFDIKELNETFSVADFQRLVRQKIAEVTARGHLPILVGGTGLYLKAALFDYTFPMQTNTPTTYEHLSDEALYTEVEKRNPAAAQSIHPHNRKRLLRALAIAETMRSEKITLPPKQSSIPLYDFLCLGLTSDRSYVYERINQRVETMFANGLEAEARFVLSYPGLSLTAKQAIGYKEFLSYFDNTLSLEQVKLAIQQASRRYAKRQYTWFNNQFEVVWFDVQTSFIAQIDREMAVFLNDSF